MRVILILSLALFSNSIWAQIKLDDALQKKLEGKSNFQEIKKISLDHYQELSMTTSPSDKQQNKYVSKQLKHLNRKFWIDEFYVNADGTPGNRGQIDFNAVANLKEKDKNLKSAQTNPWMLEGPTDISADDVNNSDGIGRFDHIAFHPTASNIMWAGSPLGGLFKTVNGGASWNPLTTYLPSLGVAGIAINSLNPDIIYVLSGNSNNNGSGFFGNNYNSESTGLFKSIDGGLSWNYSGLGFALGRDLIINPLNPDILFAATSKGIYKSDDAGATWVNRGILDFVTLVNTSLGDVRDLEFKPDDYNVIYASQSRNYSFNSNGNAETRFYKSTTNGSHFEEVNIPEFSGLADGRAVIGTTIDNPGNVYLFSGPSIDSDNDGDQDSFRGFFVSNDSGNTFSKVTQTPALFSSSETPFLEQSGYDIAIAINPIDQNEIYVGGLVTWQSTNGGLTWNQYTDYFGDMHPDIHNLKYNPLNNKLFCANDGGIYRQDGDDWISLFNGLSASTFYQFEIEDDNGKLWGGAQDNGIMIRDNGSSFFKYNGGDGFDVMTDHRYDVDNGDSDDVYYTINERVCADKLGYNCNRSVDVNVDIYNEYFGKLAMSPEDENDIYVGYSHGLYYSTNAGSDWTEISLGWPANWCVSTCRSNSDVVYFAGSANGSVWNGSLNKIVNNNLTILTPALQSLGYSPNLKITDIDVSRSNHNLLYVSVGGTTSDSKVYVSNDGGSSFTNLSFDLPNVPIFCVKTDETNGIYVGTSIGIYYLPFGSSNWQPFYNGLPNVAVTEIELASNDPNNLGVPPFTKVYASTFGRGIWSADAYNACTDFLTKTGNVQGAEFYEAGTQLTSTQVLSGGQYTELKLNSGNRIKLLPGFHAPSGHYMKTYLEGCGGNVQGN